MKTFWRWTGTIFFALAFIFLAAAGLGTSVPLVHGAVCTVRLSAASRDVFNVISDDGSSVVWRPDLRSVALVSGSGGTAIWRETYKSGQTLTFQTLFERFNPRSSIVARVIPFEPAQGFDGSWKIQVIPESRGRVTNVTIEEWGSIYNPMFRFLSHYFLGYTTSMKTYLTDLSAKYGERPAVQCEGWEARSTSVR